MSDWQITFNGLTLGEAPYGLTNLTGFADSPEVRSSDQMRARAHGQWMSVDYLGGRNIGASVIVTSQHPSSAAWQAFSQALVAGQATESTLSATMPGVAYGVPVQVGARVRKLSLPLNIDYALGVGRAEIEWHCSDPRIYAATASSVTASMATASGAGASFPLTFPLTFGGATTGGLLPATNDGEFEAPWTMTINGPVVNPRIENVATGQVISFTGEVGASSALVISSLERTVLLDGASRYSWLTAGSQWFDLAPGPNTFRFAGTSGSGSATLDFRSTWI
jgi:hypothetical protein